MNLSPRARRNVGLALLGVVTLLFAWKIRSVLNPLLIGYLAAFILHPWVVALQKRGMKRRSAVNLIFGLGFAGAILTTFVLAFQFRNLAREVITNEGVRARTQERIAEFNEKLDGWFGVRLDAGALPDLFSFLREDAAAFVQEHQGAVGAAGDVAADALGFLANWLGTLVTLGGLFVLVPLYAYYLLFQLGTVHGFIARHVPKQNRERVARVGNQVGEVIANFFRGRLSVCLVKGLALSFGLLLAGVDYAFLFGMTSGFLSLVPFFGPFIGWILAAAVGVLEHGVLGSLLRTGIVFGLGEILEGYVLIPRILGDSLGLHPLVVLVAMLAGGAAFGMLGIIVALPATAAAVILLKEFALPHLKAWADEDEEPAPG